MGWYPAPESDDEREERLRPDPAPVPKQQPVAADLTAKAREIYALVVHHYDSTFGYQSNVEGAYQVAAEQHEADGVAKVLAALGSAPATPETAADQMLGRYAEQADEIKELLDTHAPYTTGNIRARVAQLLLVQPVLASGWKLVPVEPTEAMMDAAFKAHEDKPLTDWGKMVPANDDEIYRAMLNAAPTAPASAPATQEGA